MGQHIEFKRIITIENMLERDTVNDNIHIIISASATSGEWWFKVHLRLSEHNELF